MLITAIKKLIQKDVCLKEQKIDALTFNTKAYGRNIFETERRASTYVEPPYFFGKITTRLVKSDRNIEAFIKLLLDPLVYGILIKYRWSKSDIINPLVDYFISVEDVVDAIEKSKEFYVFKYKLNNHNNKFIINSSDPLSVPKEKLENVNENTLKILLKIPFVIKHGVLSLNTSFPITSSLPSILNIQLDEQIANIFFPISEMVIGGNVYPYYGLYVTTRNVKKAKQLLPILTGNINTRDNNVCFGNASATLKHIYTVMRKVNFDSVYFSNMVPANMHEHVCAFKAAFVVNMMKNRQILAQAQGVEQPKEEE